MGLTIHYSLKSEAATSEQARRQLDLLRERALDLPFQQVGEIVELAGADCDYESREPEDPHRWLLIQAEEDVHHPGAAGPGSSITVWLHQKLPPFAQLIPTEVFDRCCA